MELVDSHCHLPLIDGGAEGLDGVLARARAAEVAHMLCVSVDLESYARVAELARTLPQVSASIGVHPNTEVDAREPTVAELVTEAAAPFIVAIGETGLDYFRSSGDLEWQRERFRTHIRAARAAAKPLIVHCREAARDVIRVLREEGASAVGGVMHCFVESWDTAKYVTLIVFWCKHPIPKN